MLQMPNCELVVLLYVLGNYSFNALENKVLNLWYGILLPSLPVSTL